MKFSREILDRLNRARHVTVLTGAGISAESGIKTFRDPDGLWSKLNPAELASIDGFMANPAVVWSWYRHRVEIINSSQPNPGHYAIAEMEKLFPEFSLITQNVDRLHQRAGSVYVTELHGNIVENQCFDCGRKYTEEIEPEKKEPPMCPLCGGKIRPSVVWFGEMLPDDAIKNAEIATMQCDVFFSIGTSGEVYPAAGLPSLAKSYGAFTIEVNPNKTSISGIFDERINAPSGVALPNLLEQLKLFRKGKI